jgi:hypothetical protein
MPTKNGTGYVYGNNSSSNSSRNSSRNDSYCVPTKHAKFDLDWMLQCEAEMAGFSTIKEFIKGYDPKK